MHNNKSWEKPENLRLIQIVGYSKFQIFPHEMKVERDPMTSKETKVVSSSQISQS